MKYILIAAAFVMSVSYAQAQTATKEKTAAYKAAEELMTVMNMSRIMDEAISQMVDIQIKGNPMLEPKKEAFKSFMSKYMSWASLKDDYLKIYTTEFTEAEIKNMTAFYRTPTGQKVAAKQNIIMMKGAELGQERVQAHMSELQEMMK